MRNTIRELYNREIKRLKSTGACDEDTPEKVYEYVALLNVADVLRPLSDKSKEEVRNLLKF